MVLVDVVLVDVVLVLVDVLLVEVELVEVDVLEVELDVEVLWGTVVVAAGCVVLVEAINAVVPVTPGSALGSSLLQAPTASAQTTTSIGRTTRM